jgi:hypothetical protein
MVDVAQAVELSVFSDALGQRTQPNSSREKTLPAAQVRLYNHASTALTSESASLPL